MPAPRSDTSRSDSSAPDEQPLLPNRLDIHSRVWIAPGAVVVGEVTLGEAASVWYGCVLRGDLEPIRVGGFTNIQDLTLVHVDHGLPAIIGERVTIGHRCVIHGCEIGDDTLIGMGSVVLSGARIGRGALVAAGAVVREGFEVPAGTIAAGVPARIRGEVDEAMRRRIERGVQDYLQGAAAFLDGRLGGGPYGGGTPSGSAERGQERSS